MKAAGRQPSGYRRLRRQRGKPFLSRGGGPADPDSAAVMPNEAQAKVYILEGADHMTEQGPKRLAKGVGGAAVLRDIFADLRAASSLLPTVRSRAQIFRVQKEDNPQTEESEAFLLAESMAKAVPSAREYDLVSKTGTLTR